MCMIQDNSISCFYEDKLGVLWLGCFSRNDACIYRPSASLGKDENASTSFPEEGSKKINWKCLSEIASPLDVLEFWP